MILRDWGRCCKGGDTHSWNFYQPGRGCPIAGRGFTQSEWDWDVFPPTSKELRKRMDWRCSSPREEICLESDHARGSRNNKREWNRRDRFQFHDVVSAPGRRNMNANERKALQNSTFSPVHILHECTKCKESVHILHKLYTKKTRNAETKDQQKKSKRTTQKSRSRAH